MHSLALDIGSSSIKGGVLDLERGQVGATVSRPFPAPIAGLPAGWFEVAPLEVVQGVGEVLSELLDHAPDATNLFCSGQMGGTILVDEQGSPLTNYLSWRDQRTLSPFAPGQSFLAEVRRRFEGELLRSLGNELQAGSTTSLLFWLARNQKPPGPAIPLSIGDFVFGRIHGAAPRMHVTHAIGMLNGETADWHYEAFRQLELGSIRLPRLSDKIEPVGELRLAGKTLRVFGAYGDQQCALLGAGLTRDDLSINISTGSQVSRRVPRFSPGNYQTRRFFAGDWLNTVTHLPAGRSLNVLVDLLTELAAAEGIALRDPWAHIAKLAEKVEATDLEVDLAFFAGPLGSAGHIDRITTENLTVGHLFHAAFRAMAENYERCSQWLDSQESWRSVVVSGGLTKGVPLLRKMIQDRFPVALRESPGEETLQGLLHIAMRKPGF